MGFSSWTCAKTNLPILNSTSWGFMPETYQVVMITKGSRVFGEYGGYGRLDTDVGEVQIDGQAVEDGEVKLVLKKFYDEKRDTFEKLGKNDWDPGQGHFHDEKKIKAWYAKGGFRSFKSYSAAYNSP